MVADEVKTYEVLERLYKSEINARVQWQWDGGYDTYLLAGFDNEDIVWEMEKYTTDFSVAMTNLAQAACMHYPTSEFAKWWKAA
jgi:hypothetical protein